jgi:hypothetical protein
MSAKASPDPIYDFIVGFDYTDEAIARWSELYPALASDFRELAMAARLDQLRDEGDVDAYLPPDPDAERHCWD